MILTKSIKQSVTLPASQHEVFELIMDAKKHGKFTGSKVAMSRKVGGKFAVFGGGLSGKNLQIVKDKKIVQAWQCKMEGWPKEHFSRAIFFFKKARSGMKLEFLQTGVPAACFKMVSDGWRKFYWEPMKKLLKAHRPSS